MHTNKVLEFLSGSTLVRQERGVEVPTLHFVHLPQSDSDFLALTMGTAENSRT